MDSPYYLLCGSAGAGGVITGRRHRARTGPRANPRGIQARRRSSYRTWRLRSHAWIGRFDPETGQARGELVVDGASGNSGSQARDQRMHKDILQSALFPEIVFTPDRVVGKVALNGPSQVQLHGMFRIHGSEHELSLPVEIQASQGQFNVTTHFTLPYVAWGLKNPSTLFLRVSDKVEISIHTVARVTH
jgi:polyisoprenoid-binding protein YceI